MEELLGEATGLSEEEEDRRSNNYIKFLKDAEGDGGYRRIDVLSIAYRFRDHWGKGIRVEEKFVREGYVLRRAFTPKDIAYIEVMIVSCDRYSKLSIIDGVLVPYFSTRPTWTTGLSEPLLASKPTPMPTTATGEESPAILPTPKNLFEQTPVESTTPLTLLLKDIAVTTKDGWVLSQEDSGACIAGACI